MARDLRKLLVDDRVHVVDGAMGTVLYGRGIFVSVCYDELNFTEPAMVGEVHRDYVKAGAEIIETNTFGANPVKLSSHGLDDRTEELNKAAVAIARDAASDATFVVGAMGPLGIRIEPWGPTSREEATELFGRQVTGLLEGGVDGFVLETFSDVPELQCAIAAVRSRTDLPIFAQMTLEASGSTAYGTSVESAAHVLASEPIDVIGINCSVGPAAMLDAVERLAEVTSLPISALPNAGLPRAVADRQIYLASPEYMAQYARRLIEAGARFVGGCCGTTPEHVSRISEYVASMQPRISSTSLAVISDEPTADREPAPLMERSGLGSKLAQDTHVIVVEQTPPVGWEAGPLISRCRALKQAGVHAVHLRSPYHGRTMGSLAAAMIVQREAELETVAHYTCRDRNMLGMLRDLLGAAAGGQRNVVLDTGAPSTTDQIPKSTAVFDIDSIGLTNVVSGLNRGIDPGGSPIGEPTRFVIGVTIKPGAVELEREIKRFEWKADAGADFAITEPVYDGQSLRDFLEQSNRPEVSIIAGVQPLQSLREAEYLANEVPWIYVPPEVVERMRSVQQNGPEASRAEGLRIAAEICESVLPLVQGIHLRTSDGEPDRIVELINALPVARAM